MIGGIHIAVSSVVHLSVGLAFYVYHSSWLLIHFYLPPWVSASCFLFIFWVPVFLFLTPCLVFGNASSWISFLIKRGAGIGYIHQESLCAWLAWVDPWAENRYWEFKHCQKFPSTVWIPPWDPCGCHESWGPCYSLSCSLLARLAFLSV